MGYAVKFKGGRGAADQYLVKKGENLWVGTEEEAEIYGHNEAAVNAALELTKVVMMMGIPSRVMTLVPMPERSARQTKEWATRPDPRDQVDQEEDKKGQKTRPKSS